VACAEADGVEAGADGEALDVASADGDAEGARPSALADALALGLGLGSAVNVAAGPKVKKIGVSDGDGVSDAPVAAGAPPVANATLATIRMPPTDSKVPRMAEFGFTISAPVAVGLLEVGALHNQ
jgi:hypothetical protein